MRKKIFEGTRVCRETAVRLAALYRDAGARPKATRDQNYRAVMAAGYASYQDNETALFYGLSILGDIPEGTHGFQRQEQAAKLFEDVYAHNPTHPGTLRGSADVLSEGAATDAQSSQGHLRFSTLCANPGR